MDGPSTNVSRFNFRGLTVLPTVLQCYVKIFEGTYNFRAKAPIHENSEN